MAPYRGIWATFCLGIDYSNLTCLALMLERIMDFPLRVAPGKTYHIHTVLLIAALLCLPARQGFALAIPTYTPTDHIYVVPGVPSTFLKVLAFSGLEWRPKDLDCASEKAPHGIPPVLSLLPPLAEVHKEAEAAGDPPPITMAVGDLFFPDPFGRFLVDDNREELIAQLLTMARVDALILGYHDFAAPKKYLVAIGTVAEMMGIPILAANVNCTGTDAPLCPSTHAVIQRGGLKVGLVGVAPNSVPGTVDPHNIVDLEFLPQGEAALIAVEAARKEGADLVVVAAQVDGGVEGVGRLVALGKALKGKAELLVASSIYGDDLGGTVRSLDIDRGPPILGVPRCPKGIARADLEMATGDGSPTLIWHRTRIAATEDPADGDESEALVNTLGDYCREWGTPIGPGPSNPITRKDFIDYALDLLRFEAKAELAFVNDQTFGPEELFPLNTPYTLDFIYRAIPYDSRPMVTDAPGKWINTLVRSKGSVLPFRGATISSGNVQINRRLLQSDLYYSIASIEFLASGGDGHMDDSAPTFKHVPGTDNLRDLLITKLSQSPPPLLNYQDFTDLDSKLRWRTDLSLAGGTTRVSIRNCPPEGCYGKPQLTRNEFFGFNSSGKLEISAESKDHHIRTLMEARYSANKLQGTEEFARTDDLAAMDLVYRWAYWRNKAPQSSFWVPLPSLAQRLETEFNPEGSEARHLESTSSIGLRFDLIKRLEASISLATRRQILRDDSWSSGLELGYSLPRIQVVELMDTPFHAESRLTYFHALAGPEQRLLRWDNRVSFALKGPLYFNVGFVVFGFSEDNGPFATSFDNHVGIRFDWVGSKQSF